MFVRHRTTVRDRQRRRKAALLAVTALAMIAACAPRSARFSATESPRRLTVDRAVFHHTVTFLGRSQAIGDVEKRKLIRFLSRQSAGTDIEMRVSGGGSRIDTKRQAAVLAELRMHGFAATLENDLQAKTGEVRLTLVRYVVTLPRCPDWSREANGDATNTPEPNFGCATTTNLGLMVANPKVLVKGVDTGPGDGDRLARGVSKYRKGSEEKPASVTTLKVESANTGK